MKNSIKGKVERGKKGKLTAAIITAVVSVFIAFQPVNAVQTGGSGYLNPERTSGIMQVSTTLEVSSGDTKLRSVLYKWPASQGSTNSFLNLSDSGSGSLAWTPITFSSINLTDGNILVGDGTNKAAEQTLSGDITITNTGVATITAGAVATEEIADGSITNPKLADTYLLGVANGGTGKTTYPSGEILFGNGTTDILSGPNLTWDNTNRILRADATIYSEGTAGDTPTSDAGTRFMWIPSKAALRAGTVSGTQWDAANIGDNSVALGINSKASGTGSIAISTGTKAEALGDGSLVLGANSTSNTGGYIIGNNTVISSDGAISIGNDNTATENGKSSLIFGNYNVADSNNTYIFGERLKTTAPDSFVIGNAGNLVGDYLTNDKEGSLMIGFKSNKATLFVGPSPSDTSTGNVGIGTDEPQAKLDVNGAIYLSSYNPGTPTYKLYNISGALYWNGVNLSQGGTFPSPGNAKSILIDSGTAWLSKSIDQAGAAITIDASGVTYLSNDIVTTAKIADAAVTTAKIADNAVNLASPNQKVTGTLPMANGGTNAVTFETGSVVFYDGTRLTGEAGGLYWDNTNRRLGIKNSSPAAELDVNGTIKVFATMEASNDLKVTGVERYVMPSLTVNTGDGINNIDTRYLKIQSDGGTITISADPQITAGVDGQVLSLIGKSDTNLVTLSDGNGIHLSADTTFTVGLGDTIQFVYNTDTNTWNEIGRSDN